MERLAVSIRPDARNPMKNVVGGLLIFPALFVLTTFLLFRVI